MAADCSSQGIALDSTKCNKLTMKEKRELIYEMSKWPHGASEMLQSWSRQEILQVLCAEMGKERKYTGLTKVKIIENLLRIVSEKKSGVSDVNLESQSSPALGHSTSKRQRKSDHPSRLPVVTRNVSVNDAGNDSSNTVYCKNSACRATLNREDTFCKRCSCCICRQYDDNKDPSLWLICSTEPPFQGHSCGMSCHLECALKDEVSGIAKRQGGMDGTFHCVSCGKINDLLGCWRKQLTKAMDTRRVDMLCYRISLCQKLLNDTEKYKKLNQIVDEAVRKLEAEVGPLNGVPVKMGRGIVNRLSSGQEVQKLCALALELLDPIFSNKETGEIHTYCNLTDTYLIAPSMVRFEDVRATSVTVVVGCKDMSAGGTIGYSLWHRKALDLEYPAEPTNTQFAPNTRFSITGLMPSTDYHFKIVLFHETKEVGKCEVQFSTGSSKDEISSVSERSHSQPTNCSDLSNPYSMEDETNVISPEDTVSLLIEDNVLKLDNKHSSDGKILEQIGLAKGLNSPVQTRLECLPLVGFSKVSFPVTPFKMEFLRDALGRKERSKSNSNDMDVRPKKGMGPGPQDGNANGISDRDYEYYVQVIRWLECEGHIEKDFRQKFLTWYSLRATADEIRIVKVFVDSFIEDPSSLAEQLVDTFSECISSKKPSVVPAGMCMKLWH